MKIHQVCHKWQGKSAWLLKLDEPQNLLTITYINHRNISIIWHRRCFQRVIFSCQEQESLYTSFGITPYFDHYHIKAFQWKKQVMLLWFKTEIFAAEAEDLLVHSRTELHASISGLPLACKQWGTTGNTQGHLTQWHFNPGSSTRLQMLILNGLWLYWNKRNKADGLLRFVSRTVHMAL